MTLHDQQTSPDVKKTMMPWGRAPAAVSTAACGHAHARGKGRKDVVHVGVQTAIRILQMDCPTEEGLLRKKLGGMPGVTGLEFNLMQRVLTVTHATSTVKPILDAMRSLGFTPEVVDGASAHDEPAA
jgi:hypothetical protein